MNPTTKRTLRIVRRLLDAFRWNTYFNYTAKMESLYVINGITKEKRKHLLLFEYILNRINRRLQCQQAFNVLICDEGNENRIKH